MDYTRKLAEFLSTVQFESLPPEVIQKVKMCILDYLANVYGSIQLSAVQKVVDCIRSLGACERSSVFGCGFKTDLHHAAFVNGTLGEAIEAQDGLRFGGNHPGTAVIPAALLVAEEMKADGGQLIAAVVAGYEAANRIASAMHPRHTLSGFLPTGSCGTLGAAVAASRLYGYDQGKLVNALGNAGYLLPISMAEQLLGGFTVKIVQGGQGASVGILAAGLAGAGITGSPTVLEGSALKGGFTQITTGGEPQLERLTEKLGEHYSILDVYFKPYTACRHTHGAAQATLELMRKEKIRANDIQQVEVHTYAIATMAVGKGIEPGDSFVSAQFSIPFVVAACLLDGEMGPLQISEKRISDPVLIDLSKKVKVNLDKEINLEYPDKTATRVEIALKNGKQLIKQIDIPKGDPRDPFSEEEMIGKVMRFCSEGRKSSVDPVIEMVLTLERVQSLDRLTQMI